MDDILDRLKRYVLKGEDHADDLLAHAFNEIVRLRSEDSMNGECIMLMREHLERAGIEATFADDAAALAADEILSLREEIRQLKADLDMSSDMYHQLCIESVDLGLANDRLQQKVIGLQADLANGAWP